MAKKIGPKIAARLPTRLQDGGCGVPRVRPEVCRFFAPLAFSGSFSLSSEAERTVSLPSGVDLHEVVLVALLLGAATALLLGCHGPDYARDQATAPRSPPCARPGRRGGRRDAASRARRGARRRRRAPAPGDPLRSSRPRTCAAFTVQAVSASSGGQPELRAGEGADEREALAEGAPGVEVGGEDHDRACVGERAARRHRPSEEERGDGQQHRGDVARPQGGDAFAAVASRWSTERAPSSTARPTAPISLSWSPWRRSASPWARHASR